MAEHSLILGGAKSGKSDFAQALAERTAGRRVYIATAEARDQEMAERIRRHQQARDATWTTVEEPLALEEALRKRAAPDAAVLVDCLTLWLSNLLGAGLAPAEIEARGRALAGMLTGLAGPVILVANEVGMGIVPDNALARSFRDLAGGLNRTLAAACQRVVLVAAGLPLHLKQPMGEQNHT